MFRSLLFSALIASLMPVAHAATLDEIHPDAQAQATSALSKAFVRFTHPAKVYILEHQAELLSSEESSLLIRVRADFIVYMMEDGKLCRAYVPYKNCQFHLKMNRAEGGEWDSRFVGQMLCPARTQEFNPNEC